MVPPIALVTAHHLVLPVRIGAELAVLALQALPGITPQDAHSLLAQVVAGWVHCGEESNGRGVGLPQFTWHPNNIVRMMYIQWTPSNPATLGTRQSVLIRGVMGRFALGSILWDILKWPEYRSSHTFQGSRLEGVHCI